MDVSELLVFPSCIALVAIGLFLCYLHGTWAFGVWSKQGIAGPFPVPYVGTILETIIKGGFFHTDLKLREQYGKLIGEYFGGTPQLLSADPEFLRKTMIKEFSSMPNRIQMNRDGILNFALNSLTDDHWRHVRSSLSPVFTTGKLKQMLPLIENSCDRLVEHIRRTSGKPFNSKIFAEGYTMDVIASTAFGIQVDSQTNPDDPVLLNASSFMNNRRKQSLYERVRFLVLFLVLFIIPTKLGRLLERFGISVNDTRAVAYFEKLCKKILDERDGPTDHKDFVQICRENWVQEVKIDDPDTHVGKDGALWTTKGVTTNEIVANAIFLFVAGFETTSVALNFILYELAVNQELQQKAYEEVVACSSSGVTYESLSKMDYIDCVINEVLRMYPPAARTERVVSKTVEVDGVVIPKGSMMVAMIYAIHYDPDIWPQPEVFDPERFSPENKEGRHQCAFIPFGIGNRNCIGMRLALLELKIAVVHILKNFRLGTCETTLRKPLQLKSNFQMHTLNPIEIKAVPR